MPRRHGHGGDPCVGQTLSLRLQLPEQPGTRQAPLTFDGPRRAIHDVCGFLDGQPRKETEFADAGLFRIDSRESLERDVDGKHVLGPGRLPSLLADDVERDARSGIAYRPNAASLGTSVQTAARPGGDF